MNELAIFGGTPVLEGPLPAYPSIGEAEKAAVLEVMESGSLSGFYGSPGPEFLGGPMVRRFEAAWAERYGVSHAVSVNSATSGLTAAMGAIGIGPGDEVIVPPYTMSATAVAPLAYGGIPVFADIEEDTFCMDPSSVAAEISERTKAIIAVNLFGHPARLAELRALADKHGLYLIEDNAQAPLGEEYGRKCGTIGHIGVFSLNYHKHIHSGEGGVCVTDDQVLAQRLQMIRNHGENVVSTDSAELVNMIGFNYRMSELHAGIALAQLNEVDRHVERREKVADILKSETKDLDGWIVPVVREDCRHNFYMFTVRLVEDELGVAREQFSKALAAEGFPHELGYCAPLYRLPVFRKKIAIGGNGWPFSLSSRHYNGALCPVAERMHEHEVLQYQPPSWDVNEAIAYKLVEAVRKVHASRHLLAKLA